LAEGKEYDSNFLCFLAYSLDSLSVEMSVMKKEFEEFSAKLREEKRMFLDSIFRELLVFFF
jgi:hypothetical protein